jgi:hypothetical protein
MHRIHESVHARAHARAYYASVPAHTYAHICAHMRAYAYCVCARAGTGLRTCSLARVQGCLVGRVRMHVCSGLQPSLREHTKPRVHGYKGTDTKGRSIPSRMRTCAPACLHVHMPTCRHPHIHACTHARMQPFTHARMQAYTIASLCLCRYAFMGVFVPAILCSCDPASSFRLFAHTFVHPIGYAFSLPVSMHAFIHVCGCVAPCAWVARTAYARICAHAEKL